MWRKQRAQPVAAARDGAGSARPTTHAGQVLFLTWGRSEVVGLDCLLEADGSSIGVPVHFLWELPNDRGLSAWQLMLVESWLSHDRPVAVAFQTSPTGSKARFVCGDSSVLVDAPVLSRTA